MNRICDLMQALCPDGAQHVILSDVSEYSQTRVDATNLDETNFVGVDNLVAERGGRVDASYPPNTARLTAYEPGDILLGNIRPYLKKVWRATNSGGCSGDVLAIRITPEYRESLDSKFLYYVMSSDGFFAYNMRHAKGAKMPRGSKVAILNYRIPVPPLKVQHEIVRILDKFTQLEAELEAELELELEARRGQYDYYRTKFLTFGDEVPRCRLDEVAVYANGKAHEKLVVDGADIPLVTARFISRNGQANRWVPLEDVLMPGRAGDIALVLSDLPNGRALARTFYIDRDDSYAINQRVARITVNDAAVISPKFLYYVLDRNRGLLRYDNGVDQTHLSKSQVTGLPVPVPSIEEQNRIVANLERFDSLVKDISIGLPVELSARRKQYEYYRDRLLTFKELAA